MARRYGYLKDYAKVKYLRIVVFAVTQLMVLQFGFVVAIAPYDVLITADFSGDIIARPAVVEYGDTLTLICTTFNDLDNTFHWFKDAVLIQGNADIFGITAVSAADGGLYECIVNNTAGNSTANITIYVAPRVITRPQSVAAFINTAVGLSCSADGFPTPDITWSFQAKALTNETASIFNSTYTESTLVITNLLLSHGGNYLCQISSNAVVMPMSSEVTVTVIVETVIGLMNTSAFPGQYASWNCQVQSTIPLQFIWFLNWQPDFTTVGSHMNNTASSSYTLNNVSYSDDGSNVRCSANASGLVALSNNVFLTVLRPNITDITITPRPSDNNLLLHKFNDSISLACTAEGGPRIMTRWQFDDGSSVVTVADGSSSITYVVSSLSTDHTGVYYCEAIIDGMANTSRNYTLFVAPYDVMVSVNFTGDITARPAVVEYGDTLILNCTTSDALDNVFYWFKDDVLLQKNTDILSITSVSAADGGLYKCVVNNSTANITIYVAPRFISVPQSVEALIGTAVNLSCSADGFPVPDITWSFEGMNFTNETVNYSNSTYRTESTIVIHNLLFSHRGNYSCQIIGAGIVMLSDQATLKVNGAPTMPLNLMVMINNSTSVTLAWNASAMLNGIIQLYTITLLDNDMNIIENLTVSSLTSMITQLTANTSYVVNVSAVTVRSGDAASVAFTTPALPTVPLNVTVTTGNMLRALVIQWKPPSNPGGIITAYMVTYDDTMVDINDTNYTITELDPYTNYTIAVLACTSNGCGEQSDFVIGITAEEAPSPPLNVSAITINSTAVRVSWNEPDITNGIIQYYTVVYRINGSSEAMQLNSTDITVVVSNLDPFSYYVFYVLAMTVASSDPSDNVTAMTAEAAPSAPLNVIAFNLSSTSITVTWQSPMILNGIVRSYRVEYARIPDRTVADVTTTNTSVVIVMLEIFTAYQVQVFATTVVEGDGSVIVTVMTDEDTPGIPRDLFVNEINSSGITVSWVQPVVTNGIITMYEIVYSLGNHSVLDDGAAVVPVAATANTSYKVVIIGLDHFTIYTIAVRAFTRIGAGNLTETFSILTDPCSSSPPQNFRITIINSTAAELLWQYPGSPNGEIRGYSILYAKFPFIAKFIINITLDVINDATNQTAVVTGLMPFTQYSFHVRAFSFGNQLEQPNFIHIGIASEEIIVRTDEDVPEAPTNFKANAIASTMVELLWNAPDVANGILLFYTVAYNNSTNSLMLVYNNETFNASITGLNEDTFYLFVIYASTAIGPGPNATDSVVTFEDCPSAPPQNVTITVINSTAILISWNPPSFLDQNGDIIGYQLIITSRINSLAIMYNITNVTFYIATMLEEFEIYVIEIAACTLIGSGPFSDPVSSQTFEDVPTAAPSNVSLTVSTSTSITLTWERPPIKEENGILLFYHVMVMETQIHYTNDGEEIRGMERYLNRTYNISEGRAQLIDMLHPDYNYTVKIAAGTEPGIGPFSDPITVRTRMDAPTAAPRNVSVTVNSSTSIILAWKRPPMHEENGLLLVYHVIVMETQIHYTDDGEEIRGMERYLNRTYYVSEGRAQLIDMLHPDYNYTVTIAAATEPGIGPFSDPITVRTHMDVPTEVPSNVSVTVSSSTSITLTWERPPMEEENGQLLVYHVIVIETLIHFTDDGEVRGMERYLNRTYNVSEGREQVFDLLHPDYNYTVSIAAATEPGIGPFSDPITVRTHMHGPVIIRSSGGEVENQSLINNFVVNGTDIELSLTCTSMYQNEIVEWVALNISGKVELKFSNVSYSSTITFARPADNFISVFRCKSTNTLLFKDVAVIKRNPFFDLLTNATIYAPLASSPVISIIVAIDSDGTTSHQDVISESLVLTRLDDEDFMGKFKQDSTNFQLYHYKFPPLKRQSMGRYVIYSELNGVQKIEIEVNINTKILTLKIEFASVTLLEGSTVTLSCIPSVFEIFLSWTHNGADLNEDKNTTFLPMNLNHELILDDADVDDSGQYICRAMLDDDVIEGRITVTVVPACNNEFSGGLFWNNSRRNLIVTQPCSILHPNFRSGVEIARQCYSDGNWSSVDMTACTMFLNSNPVLVVHFTVIKNDLNSINSSIIIDNILNQIQLNVVLVNSFSRTWSYRTDSESLLLSFTISVGLQSIVLSNTLVNNIKNSLIANASSIIPSSFVLTDESFMLLAFQPNSSCLCNDTSSNPVQTVCSGPSTAPCRCGVGSCMCNEPTYVGDGHVCGLDSDSDGFPDEDLDCSQPFCSKDLCPAIYSRIDANQQSNRFCDEKFVFAGGCPFEIDKTWSIAWPATDTSSIARQKCPGGSEAEGIATRQCNQTGNWEDSDVSECRTVEQIRLENRAEKLNTLVTNMFVNDNRDFTEAFMPEIVVDIADELNEITNTSTPILPNDITSTANTLNIIILVTNLTIREVNQEVVAKVIRDAVKILDTLLDERNDLSFEVISTQSSDKEASSQSVSEQLLMNTEQVGVLLVSTLNSTSTEIIKTISNPNLVIQAQITVKEDLESKGSIQFPNNSMDASLIFDNMMPVIEIPSAIILRQLEKGKEVPIINIVARNSRLPTDKGQQIASLILSSQISTDSQDRLFLEGETIQLTFSIGKQENATWFNPRCAFFNFSSNSNESGSFSTDGIEQRSLSNDTFVQCTTTHLTSFAVLVDTSGESIKSKPLSIVSYIGCSISIPCLIFTIIVMIALRRNIFSQTQHFLHLNLSIALLLGLVTFVSGIETATEYRESCLAVAILLHYFFMAAFCWMLSEGVLLFIMLYLVFYKGFLKSKIFFFAIGWGLPIPIVVVSAGLFNEYYGINDRCWISEENETIWAFIGPMSLIILINIFFLIATMYQVFKAKQSEITAEKSSKVKAVKGLLKAAIIIIPMLGSTWIFGLLSINEDTVFFAWIFTILNSLQGLFIMFFYVLRNDKVLRVIKCRTMDSRNSKSSRSSRTVSTSGKQKEVTSIKKGSTVNVHNAAKFDENDEIQSTDVNRQVCTVISDLSPSHYLRHQQNAEITNSNTISDEETEL